MTSALPVQPHSDWNPDLYMKFEDERTLAARDLLARVPLARADVVYDLGCGPGNSAELLGRRFPQAAITGLDTSEAMLAHARVRAAQARFIRQDIVEESWRIVQPLLAAPPRVQSYRKGTWGPAAAARLLPRDDPWRAPWVNST